MRRQTSFVPAPNVAGSRLATDRAVRMTAAQEEAMLALGGVKLGVLHVHVVDRVDPHATEPEEIVWPGASIDAAALGATHARKLTLEVPPQTPYDCRRTRSQACAVATVLETVRAQYELWYVAPEQWAQLPESLRPNALPPSAIRDVQPGNWVRPPPVVTVKAD